MEAIGALVERDFGGDGVFVGTVVGFRDEKGVGKLYRVKYSDGDVEDLDQEEYNFAYAMKLKSDGWVLEEGPIECGDTHGVLDGVSAEDDSGKDEDDEFLVDVLAREKTEQPKNSTTGGVNDRCQASGHTEGEVLSAYEELRVKNMERNHKIVAELGLLGGNQAGNSKKRKSTSNNLKELTQKRKVLAFLQSQSCVCTSQPLIP